MRLASFASGLLGWLARGVRTGRFLCSVLVTGGCEDVARAAARQLALSDELAVAQPPEVLAERSSTHPREGFELSPAHPGAFRDDRADPLLEIAGAGRRAACRSPSRALSGGNALVGTDSSRLRCRPRLHAIECGECPVNACGLIHKGSQLSLSLQQLCPHPIHKVFCQHVSYLIAGR